MFSKILHFLKYNNATVLAIALVFVLGTGVFAAENPQALGQQQTSVQGVDNTLLLSADLDSLNMDFKIGNIQEDDRYYYVNYTFLDLDILNNAWQYQVKEKNWKISKKLKKDLGLYLAGKFSDMRAGRIDELKDKQAQARLNGATNRIQVTEYSGLIGKVLDTAANIFPGYVAVQKQDLPSPVLPPELGQNNTSPPDNLTNVYLNYVNSHPDQVNSLGSVASSSPPAPDTSATSTASGTASTTDQTASTTVEPDVIIATTTPDTSTATQTVEIVQ